MSIRDLENSKVLRKYGAQLGRKGIAERIIELAKEIEVGDGAYQSTLRNAGKIRALCVAAKYDTYWDEKQGIGYHDMIEEARYKTQK